LITGEFCMGDLLSRAKEGFAAVIVSVSTLRNKWLLMHLSQPWWFHLEMAEYQFHKRRGVEADFMNCVISRWMLLEQNEIASKERNVDQAGFEVQ
jgi:hypothetical protein